MNTIHLPYAGDGFHPPLGTTFMHDGREYTAGELMHIEIRDGAAKSYVRAYAGSDIGYFEFQYEFPTSVQVEGTVLHLPRQPRAHA